MAINMEMQAPWSLSCFGSAFSQWTSVCSLPMIVSFKECLERSSQKEMVLSFKQFKTTREGIVKCGMDS